MPSDKAVARKRIKDLDALMDCRALPVIWHGIVVPMRSGTNTKYAYALHSAVASCCDLMRRPATRKKLIKLVEEMKQ